MNTPKWVNDFLNKEFSTGPVMGSDGKQWCNTAKAWMKKFLVEELGVANKVVKQRYNCGADEGIVWRTGHYEWSCFARIGKQWWYFSSGDVRHKVVDSLLVRKANGPNDYRGGANMHVSYSSPAFEAVLKRLLVIGSRGA